jgi:hypothetical protein
VNTGVLCRSRHCTMDASSTNAARILAHQHPYNECLCVMFGQLVPVTSTTHMASRSGLSTPSSLFYSSFNAHSKLLGICPQRTFFKIFIIAGS